MSVRCIKILNMDMAEACIPVAADNARLGRCTVSHVQLKDILGSTNALTYVSKHTQSREHGNRVRSDPR